MHHLRTQEKRADHLTCFRCHGPYHPATGWAFLPDVAYCGRCAREFAAWYKSRMRQMSRPDSDFALAASTSIRPDLPAAPARRILPPWRTPRTR